MDDLWSFVTSPEAVIVYIVVGLSCCLCFIIYLVERYNVKIKQRHNTKELNKLVEQVRDEVEEVETVTYNQPVLEVIQEGEKAASVNEMLEHTVSLKEEIVSNEVEAVPENVSVVADVPKEETLEYTSIEPDPIEAQMELSRITEELEQPVDENETLTSFEQQQEENAIISLEELTRKAKSMYEANETTQYVDEGKVPISLEELEQKMGKEVTPCTDSFVLENVVPEEENIEIQTVEEVKDRSLETEDMKRFKSSPIISPVFGIENRSDLELENTANYEKFDAEKTNEFLMTLKELRDNGD